MLNSACALDGSVGTTSLKTKFVARGPVLTMLYTPAAGGQRQAVLRSNATS